MTDRNVVIRLRGEIGDFSAKMAAAGRSVGGVVDKMTSGEKESRKFRDGLISVGDAGGKIGLGAAAALGGIIAVTANFEQKMSAVQAATHESADAMEALRDAAIQAGAETAFSASEAAEGIENLAKAGVQTAEILGGGLQGALDLAAAGTVDVAFAAETAATAMTQFGLSGEQVPHIADLLAAAAGKAQGEVSDMAYALRQSGLVANQVGLSIEETTAGLAAFAESGLLGSDAGTSFKTMLSALTPNSEKAAGAMESIGLAAYDASGNFVGLEEVARQLRTGMADLTDEQRQSTMETIFGSDAVRAASVLYDQGARGIREWTDAVNDQGFAAETAAIKLDNLKGDFEALQGSLETALINLGSGSQGGLRGLTQGATDAVNAFNGLPGAMQGTVTQMLAITAITGGGLWFSSRVIRSVADTREALANLGETGKRTGSLLRSAFAVGAVLEGLNLLDEGIARIFDKELEQTNLGRSLDALASGNITGEIADVFGTDLAGFAEDVDKVTSAWTIHNRVLANVPLAGGILAGGVDESVANIEKLDAALASMVESGDKDAAAAVFKQLSDAAVAAGTDLETVTGLFDQYEVAVANAGGALTAGQLILSGATTVQGAWAAAVAASTEEVDAETQALEDNVKAMEDKRQAALEAENAEIAYYAALDDAAAALKENGRNLDITTEEGRANRTALLGVAEAWNEQSTAAQNARGAYQSARRDFVQTAIQMGMTRKEAERYARELMEIPPRVLTRAELDTSQARQAIRDLKAAFAGLGNVPFLGAFGAAAGALGQFRDGGYTGNLPVSSVAGVVHGGEFVHTAEVTSMFRPLFEYIHQHKRLPGYREGGYVQQISQPTTNHYGESIDYDRLARAMQMVRPLYDNVHFHGQDDYQKQEAKHRRSRAGGAR